MNQAIKDLGCKKNRIVMRLVSLPKEQVLLQGRDNSRMSDGSILFTKGIVMEQPNNQLIDAIVLILAMMHLFTALPNDVGMVQPIYEFIVGLIK